MCRDRGALATIPFADFHLLPGNTPHRETVLEPGDLITHVTLPPPRTGSKQVYLKLRDRASYEFALASAAVVMNRHRRKRQLRSHCAGRSGNETVAIAGSGSRAHRPTRERRNLPASRRSRSARCEAAERKRIQDRARQTLP